MTFSSGSSPCIALTPQRNPLISGFHHRLHDVGDAYSTQLHSSVAGVNPWHAMVAQGGNRNTVIQSWASTASWVHEGRALKHFTRLPGTRETSHLPFQSVARSLNSATLDKINFQEKLKGRKNKWCTETKNSLCNFIPPIIFSTTIKFHWLYILLLRQCKNMFYS